MAERYIGICKLFAKGYGFLTPVEGPFKDQDIFVHHTALVTQHCQYRTLRKGEYVEFGIVDSQALPGKKQADDVTGIKRYHLMCDTQYLAQQQREAQLQDIGPAFVGSF
jgi:cold shock CspA family protein